MGCLGSLQGINIHIMNIYTILYAKCDKLPAGGSLRRLLVAGFKRPGNVFPSGPPDHGVKDTGHPIKHA
jgi:hypothetical protein